MGGGYIEKQKEEEAEEVLGATLKLGENTGDQNPEILAFVELQIFIW